MKNIFTRILMLCLFIAGVYSIGLSQNLALNKPATASSVENASLTADKAVDGNTTTRWANVQPWTTPGWIYVDLGATYSINRVLLNWETAFANGYQVQVSDNASAWTTIFTTSTGNGGIDDLTGLSGTGRYVRMYATSRGSSYGFSLWEFEVYGTAVTTGLKGEYFNNKTLTAPVTLTRTDATVNFDWTTGSPGAGIGVDNFSVRWTGQVQAPATGSYTFSTVSDDGVRLWVNNVQVINNWTDHGSTTNNGTPVSLTANQKYDIKMEYYESGGGAVAKLQWTYPGQAQQIIPSTRLFPTTGTADTQAPSAPTGLTSSAITQTSFTLSWTASTDNVGVTGYDIYQGSVLKGSSATTSFAVTGLTCNTAYSFTVKAKDAASNTSAASSALPVTTSACATGISLTVNKANLKQTIDGFGFFGPRDNWWSSSDPSYFYTDAWLNLVLNDLGITMWRNEIYPHNPPSQNTTANQDANWDKQKPFVQALKAKADALGVDLKILLTVWTPPGAFKWQSSFTWAGDENATRGPTDQGDYYSEKNGGTLNPNKYNAFATWLTQAVQMYKDAGVTPYAISPQNEPLFVESYNSCTYTTYWYRDMIKAVIPQVKSAHPGLKVFGSENMLELEGADINYPYFYHNTLKNDATAMGLIDRISVHGYSNGVNPSSGSNLAQYWTNHKTQFSAPFNKPDWMTETSGYADTWESSGGKPGAINLALDMHAALFYGDLAGWLWWTGSSSPGSTGAIGEFELMHGTTVGKKYYASKQFYRYIRPGARRMETSSPDSNIYLTAYYHAGNNTHTIVLINTASTSKIISISGSNLPATYDMYVTSASQNNQLTANVSANGITLPARSVVTLQAGGTPLQSLAVAKSVVALPAMNAEWVKDKEVVIYPNPTSSGKFTVQVYAERNEEAVLTLLGASSQPVFEMKRTLSKGYNTIEMPAQSASGLYFLKIIQGGRQLMKKVVVQR